MLQLRLNKSKLILVFGIVSLFVATIYVHEINQPAKYTITLDELEPTIVYSYENQIGWSNPLGANGEQIFDNVTGKPLRRNY